MKEQPEALRLANALDECKYVDVYRCKQAAAELRRLHAENEALRERVEYWKRKHDDEETGAERDALRAQRDALLEALRAMRVKCGKYACCVCDLADAAIAKVEEQT